jgi:TolB protein
VTTSTPSSTAPATTARPTTTLEPAPVTTGPTYPSALGRHLVPWDEVGPGWSLVLYDACSGPGGTEQPVYYLVDPAGTRYEIASTPLGYGIPGGTPTCMNEAGYSVIAGAPMDWAPAGAVAVVDIGCCAALSIDLLDLGTGELTSVAGSDFGDGTRAGLTRPTGEQLVADTFIDTRTLARYDRQGHLQTVLAERPLYAEDPSSLAWLYRPDGTQLVIGGPPPQLIANDGTVVRELADVPAQACDPKHWWDDATVVAACRAPSDSPDTMVESVWLVPLDGSAAQQLATGTACAPGICGYTDAWRVGDVTVVQRHDYQSGSPGIDRATLEVVADDGSTAPFAVGGSTGEASGAGAHDGRLLVVRGGELVSVDAGGGDLRVLVPSVGGAQGVQRTGVVVAQ